MDGVDNKIDPRRPGSEALSFVVYFAEIENLEAVGEVMVGQGSKPSRL
jgi:hypothetical protein